MSVTDDWTAQVPTVILFVIGLGGLAAALLYIKQLYREVVPDGDVQMHEDIGTIKRDLHEIRKRVGMLEIEVAKIDQPAIVKRFDSIETKIDRLYEFLIERFSADGSSPKRR
ncbi:MAG: hypothetical protein B7Y80_21015 [Hyphomicrobium sp. 32-62-53]|nr:MAG: hypothetical protein B7Z29_20875 [Hyphomicrobium sp. 12-62-95]OYX97050.1 MAG: hypothetical protein B7Y80_21015 [Hyphomicrobium sp. 32-62-53]